MVDSVLSSEPQQAPTCRRDDLEGSEGVRLGQDVITSITLDPDHGGQISRARRFGRIITDPDGNPIRRCVRSGVGALTFPGVVRSIRPVLAQPAAMGSAAATPVTAILPFLIWFRGYTQADLPRPLRQVRDCGCTVS